MNFKTKIVSLVFLFLPVLAFGAADQVGMRIMLDGVESLGPDYGRRACIDG